MYVQTGRLISLRNPRWTGEDVKAT